VEAFTQGGAAGPVNIAYSRVYQWWYTIELRTNKELYTGALFLWIPYKIKKQKRKRKNKLRNAVILLYSSN
jgi:hypothetical protein